VFTNDEIIYCESKKNKIQHYAVRFAAKEAFMKAIGTGWDKGINWKNIEIRNHFKEEIKQNSGIFSGKPEIILNRNFLEFSKKDFKVYVSLSHTNKVAIAFVVLEQSESDI
jgi:holo-[acyl-carrier protein] synthase